jgi:hypothetical protein
LTVSDSENVQLLLPIHSKQKSQPSSWLKISYDDA